MTRTEVLVLLTANRNARGIENWNKLGAGTGKRNKKLNQAAVRAARKIGPIDLDYGDDRKCEPFDVLKHLTNPALKKELG